MAADQAAPAESATPAVASSPPQISPWALIALLCSMCALCPPASIIGPVLALRALLQIKAQPERYRGEKYAWWAIGLGGTFTIMWVLVAFWWNANIRQPLMHGPIVELRAGMAGDIVKFKEGFYGSQAGSNAEAEAFLQAIRQRYGDTILVMEQTDDAAMAQLPKAGRAVIPYHMRLDRGAVPVQAEFMISEQGRPPMVLKWGWIRIIDAASGDLVYPAASTPATFPAATQPSP